MKKVITTVIMLSAGCLSLFAQKPGKNFKLEGDLTAVHKDSVLLSYRNAGGEYVHTSWPVQQGKFSITGSIDGPESAAIGFKDKDEKSDANKQEEIFIEPGLMAIKVDPNKLSDLVLTGSQTQKDDETYEALIRPYDDAVKALVDSGKLEKDPVKKAALKAKIPLYEDKAKTATYDFFIGHPDSYITEYWLQMYEPMMNIDSVKMVYNALPQWLKQNYIGKYIGDKLQAIDATAPGKTASDFKTTDVNGNPVALSDFKGKYVLLDFWASWCVPCRQSHSHLRAVYNKYHSQGLEIIGVADDDTRIPQWKEAIVKDSIGIWHHVLGGSNMDKTIKGEKNAKDIMARYGIQALPTKFLIDPNGVILAKAIGDDLKDVDEALIKAFKN